ncbi:hypothetical protein [Rarobacter incanus]|uniref:Protein ImuB n=1 Tax=Rarobacter incanus TaxID=153494 RepID=A0A542SMB8_9MICO|nr:hypothetical protein [Rarobacter incanus]TQK75771.1 protein ImuB [Rarobacter incanus]
MIPQIFAVWVPDWPAVSALMDASLAPDSPIVIMRGGRVLSSSAIARAQGVRTGMRKRTAQEVSPAAVFVSQDGGRECANFEPVIVAAHGVLPGWTMIRPGLMWAQLRVRRDGATAGAPADAAGAGVRRAPDPQEHSLKVASDLVDAIAHYTGVEAHVGVGGSVLGAAVAARTDAYIEPRDAAKYVRAQSVDVLALLATDAGERVRILSLVQSLHGLGVRTMDQLLAVGPAAINTRFGALGAWAVRQAALADDPLVRPWQGERIIEEHAILEPPAERAEQVMFAAIDAAERWYQGLLSGGLSCAQVDITLHTVGGEAVQRLWQADSTMWGGLTPRRVLDRLRWQVEAWLQRSEGDGRQADQRSVHRVTLRAVGLHPVDTQQEGLWGNARGGDGKAKAAIDRMCTMVEPGDVLQPRRTGGRTPIERIALRPWGQGADPATDDTAGGIEGNNSGGEQAGAASKPNGYAGAAGPRKRKGTPTAVPSATAQGTESSTASGRPWPGALPSPAPSAVLTGNDTTVSVTDRRGNPVTIDDRLNLSAEPHLLQRGTGQSILITNWAGPWSLLQRSWYRLHSAATTPGGGIYLQILTEPGQGYLLVFGQAQWRCEGIYD